jgi:hypothetical protein
VCDAYEKSIGLRQARAAEIAMRIWRHTCHDSGMRGVGDN